MYEKLTITRDSPVSVEWGNKIEEFFTLMGSFLGIFNTPNDLPTVTTNNTYTYPDGAQKEFAVGDFAIVKNQSVFVDGTTDTMAATYIITDITNGNIHWQPLFTGYYVDRTTDQTIGGEKTFVNTVTFNVPATLFGANITNSLSVGNDASINGTLTAKNIQTNNTLTTQDIQVNGSIQVEGTTTLNGDFIVNGSTSVLGATNTAYTDKIVLIAKHDTLTAGIPTDISTLEAGFEVDRSTAVSASDDTNKNAGLNARIYYKESDRSWHVKLPIDSDDGNGNITTTLVDYKISLDNHRHDNATEASDGFMSSTDKQKLDNIATQANKVYIDSSNNALIAKDAAGNTTTLQPSLDHIVQGSSTNGNDQRIFYTKGEHNKLDAIQEKATKTYIDSSDSSYLKAPTYDGTSTATTLQTVTLDNINAGTTNVHYTATEQGKLAGIVEGATKVDFSESATTTTTTGFLQVTNSAGAIKLTLDNIDKGAGTEAAQRIFYTKGDSENLAALVAAAVQISSTQYINTISKVKDDDTTTKTLIVNSRVLSPEGKIAAFTDSIIGTDGTGNPVAPEGYNPAYWDWVSDTEMQLYLNGSTINLLTDGTYNILSGAVQTWKITSVVTGSKELTIAAADPIVFTTTANHYKFDKPVFIGTDYVWTNASIDSLDILDHTTADKMLEVSLPEGAIAYFRDSVVSTVDGTTAPEGYEFIPDTQDKLSKQLQVDRDNLSSSLKHSPIYAPEPIAVFTKGIVDAVAGIKPEGYDSSEWKFHDLILANKMLKLGDASSLYPYLSKSDNTSARVQTAYGYIDIGPQNSTHCHIHTDRSSFYFNKTMYVDGSIYPYPDNSANLGSSSQRFKDLYLSGDAYHYKGIGWSEGGVSHILQPSGAKFSGGNGQTGAIKITLPQNKSSTMIRMVVDIYDYKGSSAGESVTLMIGGYNYADGSWYHYFAHVISGRSDKNFKVRFGNDSNKSCIWIGETSNTWNFLKVIVRDVVIGHMATSLDNWIDDWNITLVSSFDTVKVSTTAALNASTLAGLSESTFMRKTANSDLDMNTHNIKNTKDITPKTSGSYNLGSSSLKYKNLYLSGDADIGGDLTVSGSVKINGNTVWHAGNDGSGSGLDADTVDGIEGEWISRQAPINVWHNTLSGAYGSEKGYFTSMWTNKLEFFPIDHILVETSTDGTNWSTSTEYTDLNLKRLVGGDSYASISIPNLGSTGTAYKRFTFSNYQYVYVSELYLYTNRVTGTLQIKVEAYHNTNGWTVIKDFTEIPGWPGHHVLRHSNIAFSSSSSQYGKLRLTFYGKTTNSSYINHVIYKIQWWGGYPAGKRTVYSVDSSKNVSFPATLYAPSLDLSGHNNTVITLQPATSGGTSSILFNSKVNEGSDKGYLTWYDDNNDYDFWGTTSDENGALVLGVENDGQTSTSDVVVLKSHAGIIIDAPDLFYKNGTNINTYWHDDTDLDLNEHNISNTKDITPKTSGSYNLGSSSLKYKNLYLSNTLTFSTPVNTDIINWAANGRIKRITNQGGILIQSDSSMVLNAGDQSTVDKLGISDTTTNENLYLTADGVVYIKAATQNGFNHANVKTWTFSSNGTTTIPGNLIVSGSSATINGNTVWHTGNDGSGSGLDADKLDGFHADDFVQYPIDINLDMNHHNITNISTLYPTFINGPLLPQRNQTIRGIAIPYKSDSNYWAAPICPGAHDVSTGSPASSDSNWYKKLWYKRTFLGPDITFATYTNKAYAYWQWAFSNYIMDGSAQYAKQLAYRSLWHDDDFYVYLYRINDGHVYISKHISGATTYGWNNYTVNIGSGVYILSILLYNGSGNMRFDFHWRLSYGNHT